MDPTPAGFMWFIRTIMKISTTYLPDSAGVIEFVYALALQTVNLALQCVPNPTPTAPNTYAIAVYNLAADLLLNLAQDEDGAPVYKTIDGRTYTYFEYVRHTLNLGGFTPGVIQSTNDLTTGGSYVVPEAFQHLTIGDLSNLKTPYGRMYLSIAQDYGPTEVGIS